MAYYHCILFDMDGTLLDFEAAEHKALLDTFRQFGLPTDHETEQLYVTINKELWAALEKGQIKRDKLLVERFAQLLKKLGMQGNAAEMGRWYLNQLAMYPDAIPNALEAIRELSEVATLAIVSNGVAKVQQSRLKASGLEPYMDDVFISEKIGVEKPNRRFFEHVLKTLGIEQREKVLVVGDSLSADIKGGQNAGLATCWCNFNDQPEPTQNKPTYTIQSLQDLYSIVMEEDELQNVGLTHRKHQF